MDTDKVLWNKTFTNDYRGVEVEIQEDSVLIVDRDNAYHINSLSKKEAVEVAKQILKEYKVSD